MRGCQSATSYLFKIVLLLPLKYCCMEVRSFDYSSLSYFSKKDTDYIKGSDSLKEFMAYAFEFSSFSDILKKRKAYSTDRTLLQNVIKKQYEKISPSGKTLANIESLGQDNCFTVITAHQPSLLTGPLYYVFKILSTINLAQQISNAFEDYTIVPVFVLGAEDHDFEEINHFNLFSRQIIWDKEAFGPVGRLTTDGLDEVLEEFSTIFQNNETLTEFSKTLSSFIKQSESYFDFCFQLTHALFDTFGLVIVSMDDVQLKRAFIPFFEKELVDSPSELLVQKTQANLAELGYNSQAFARPVNIFYFYEGRRLRIERTGGLYQVLDTGKQFSEAEIMRELHEHPEKFSPNVIMRPLYQEYIFPNLAYVGGGGELAYWLERKNQFESFNIHFPMLIRRNSAMIITEGQQKAIEKLSLKLEDLFQDESALINTYLAKSANPDYSLDNYKEQIKTLFNSIEAYAQKIDQGLKRLVQAELTKSEKSIEYIESKLRKSLKQKEDIQIKRIIKLYGDLFPSGLQERHSNIFQFIGPYGFNILGYLLEHMDPFDKSFKVFIMQAEDRE